MRPSYRCWPMRCSDPAASWSWVRTRRWPPSSSVSSCHCPAGDPHRAVALASMMAIVSGVVCILAGVARLGFITELLSKPIRYGYMNGIALTVLISQLPKLFGFSIESDGPLRSLWAIGERDPGRWHELDGVRSRRRHARGDPSAQGQQARARHPRRRGRRDRDRRCARSCGAAPTCRCWVRCRRACPVRDSLDHREPTSSRC